MSSGASLLGALVVIAQQHFEVHTRGATQKEKCVKIMRQVRTMLPALEAKYLSVEQSPGEVAKMLHLLDLLLTGKVCHRSREDIFQGGGLGAMMPRVAHLFRLLCEPAKQGLTKAVAAPLASCFRLVTAGAAPGEAPLDVLADDACVLVEDLVLVGAAMLGGDVPLEGADLEVEAFGRCPGFRGTEGGKATEASHGRVGADLPAPRLAIRSRREQLFAMSAAVRLLRVLFTNSEVSTPLGRSAALQRFAHLVPRLLHILDWHLSTVVDSPMDRLDEALGELECLKRTVKALERLADRPELRAHAHPTFVDAAAASVLLAMEQLQRVTEPPPGLPAASEGRPGLRRVSKPVLNDEELAVIAAHNRLAAAIQDKFLSPLWHLLVGQCNAALDLSPERQYRLFLGLAGTVERACAAQSFDSRTGECVSMLLRFVVQLLPARSPAGGVPTDLETRATRRIVELLTTLQPWDRSEGSVAATVDLGLLCYHVADMLRLPLLRVALPANLPAAQAFTAPEAEAVASNSFSGFGWDGTSFCRTGERDLLGEMLAAPLEAFGAFCARHLVENASRDSSADRAPPLDGGDLDAGIALLAALLVPPWCAAPCASVIEGSADAGTVRVLLRSFCVRGFLAAMEGRPMEVTLQPQHLAAVLDLGLGAAQLLDAVQRGSSHEASGGSDATRLVAWCLRVVEAQRRGVLARLEPSLSGATLRYGREDLALFAEPFAVRVALLVLLGLSLGAVPAKTATALLTPRLESAVLEAGTELAVAVASVLAGTGQGFTATLLDHLRVTPDAAQLWTVAEALASVRSLTADAMPAATALAPRAAACAPLRGFLDRVGRISGLTRGGMSVDLAMVQELYGVLLARLPDAQAAVALFAEAWAYDLSPLHAYLSWENLDAADLRLLAFPALRSHFLAVSPLPLGRQCNASPGQTAALAAVCSGLRMELSNGEDPAVVDRYRDAYVSLAWVWFRQDSATCHAAFDALHGEVRRLDSGFYEALRLAPERLLPGLFAALLRMGAVSVFAEHVAGLARPTFFLAVALPHVLPSLLLEDLAQVKPEDDEESFIDLLAHLAIAECRAASLEADPSGASPTSNPAEAGAPVASPLSRQERRLLEALSRPEIDLGPQPGRGNFLLDKAQHFAAVDLPVMRVALLLRYPPHCVAAALRAVQAPPTRPDRAEQAHRAKRLVEDAFARMRDALLAPTPTRHSFHDTLKAYEAHTLRLLVAELGRGAARAAIAHRAIELLAMLGPEAAASEAAASEAAAVPRPSRKRRKGAHGGVAVEAAVAPVAKSVETRVERLMAEHWLYVMNALVTVNWRLRPAPTREALLRCMQRSLVFLGPASLARFAPKVLRSCATALEDASVGVGRAGVEVLGAFVKHAQAEALWPHLAGVCLPLFSRLLDGGDAAGDLTEPCLAVVNRLLDRVEQEGQRARLLETLPLLPPHPSLASTARYFDAQHSRRSLPAELALMAKFLVGSEPAAQALALLRLEEVLRERRAELRALTLGGDAVDPAVQQLLRQLFRLSAAGLRPQAALALAACLGEIGAVDPSRLGRVAGPLAIEGGEAGGRGAGGEAPWCVDAKDLALRLLEQFLAPGFRAAKSVVEQDRMGLAIQGILRILGRDFAKENASGRTRRRGADRVATPPASDKGDGGDEAMDDYADDALLSAPTDPMPAALRAALKTRGLLETVAPFWSSKYELAEAAPKSPPFFRRVAGYERWLGLWARYLVARTSGPFRDVLRACASALSGHADLALFLLPYGILDLWVFNATLPKLENTAVRRELLGVLEDAVRHGTDGPKRRRAQAVFGLLDTLWGWIGVEGDGGSSARRRGTPRLGADGHRSDWPKGRMALREQGMNQIDKLVLARAALICDAHARALKYFEMHVRHVRIAGVQEFASTPEPGDDSVNWRDGANGQLPRLEVPEIHFLHATLLKMDDTDAIAGLQSARRAAGRTPSLRERCGELTHLGHWEDALDSYETALGAEPVPEPGLSSALSSPVAETALFPWEAHHGILTSLASLGHLESTLLHYKGFAQGAAPSATMLLPSAVDAAWQLEKWDDLANLLKSCEDKSAAGPPRVQPGLFAAWGTEDRVKVLFGRAISSLASIAGRSPTSPPAAFQLRLREAQLHAMDTLSAAAMESYARSYPLCLALHQLRELEMAHAALDRSSDAPRSGSHTSMFSDFSPRFVLTAPAQGPRTPLLALRRVLLNLSGGNKVLEGAARACSLADARACRDQGAWRGARHALQCARRWGLAPSEALRKEAKLLQSQGDVAGALARLGGEGFGVDASVAELRPNLLAQSEAARTRAAKTLLCATEWIAEAGLRHGDEVLERFHLARELRPQWPKAYFAIARYYDWLLAARKRDGGGGDAMRRFGLAAMENYARGLAVGGGGSKQLFTALPRLLTLWLDESVDEGRKGGGKAGDAIMREAVETVAAQVWYAAQAQLLSRVAHGREKVSELVAKILVKVLVAHTPQALWTVGALGMSADPVRKKKGARMRQAAMAELTRRGDREDDVQTLREAPTLFESLIRLAGWLPREAGTLNFTIGADISLRHFLVPTQSALSLRPPPGDPFLDHAPRIHAFLDDVHVMRSKAKPKRLSCLTSDGSVTPFLCKREERGDLRKDARLMEVCHVVNRFLRRDAAAATRHLRLRTYSVLCLNEECGILEWVPHTGVLKSQIEAAYRSQLTFRMPGLGLIRSEAERLQKQCLPDVAELGKRFRAQILRRFPPCFHRWFVDQFPEPGQWLAARNTYARAAALWSALGHCVGLGDRHGENILLCIRTGEVVHVDFDCLFDKGLALRVPEIVPFRLTANMVDALGLWGVEGPFRSVLEVALALLRRHREALLSMLEPFLRDPTVGWERQGRAAREQGGGAVVVGGLNDEAQKTLTMVEERLRGIYNLKVPAPRRKGAAKAVPVGEDAAERVPLSVPGQVDRLLKEATDTNNLARMFVGWTSWL